MARYVRVEYGEEFVPRSPAEAKAMLREGKIVRVPTPAAEAYDAAGADRPYCDCHGFRMVWQASARYADGGHWTCSVDNAETWKASARRKAKRAEETEIGADAPTEPGSLGSTDPGSATS